MNHDRYLAYNPTKKINSLNINNNEQKRFIDEKNKRKIKEKPNNYNKDKLILKDRRTFNKLSTFNEYNSNTKLKTELNKDKENKNKLKERKSIYQRNFDYIRTNDEEKKNNRNLNQTNKNPAIINQQNNNINIYTNSKLLKCNFTGKTLNPDLKKNINSGNYCIYGQSNNIDSSYEPSHYYKYNYNEENPNNKSSKNRTIDHNKGQVIQFSNSNYKIGSNIINLKEKYVLSQNNNIEYRLTGHKKIKNKYKPINNNIIYKTIDAKTNEEIYDYSDVKKRQYKEINNKKENFGNNQNERITNNININSKIVSIQMNNLGKYNFHKNNSSSTIYCSPKKMHFIDNKRTIDDKNFINFDKQEKGRNNYNCVNNNYIYKKNRNVSCMKARDTKRNLDNVFKKENENKSKNNSINKSKYMDLSFNSPTSTYSKKDERNSVSYLDNNKIINIQNKTNNKRNDKRVYEVNELFNRNDRERSKFTTIQNSEEDAMSNNSISKKNGKVVKRYYYQTVQENPNKNNFLNTYNIGNNDRTYKKKRNIIYENNANSFDRNSEEKIINYDDENYRDNLSHYNYKKNNFNIKSPTISEMSNEKANINDNILKLNENILTRETDFINKGRKRNNNKKNNFNENYKISKTIRTKKIITDSIARKKFSNSFNNELTDYENDNKKNNNNDNNNYNNYNISQVNNFAQKNSNKLILKRGLNINANLYTKTKNKLYQDVNITNNNKNVNSSLFEKKINFTGKSSPKAKLSYNENSPSPTRLTQDDELLADYFYSNSKTIEDFHRKTKDSMESSPKSRKNALYHKKKSQNHYAPNNPRMIYELNNEFNKTCYLKKYTGENIYYKKNLKNKMSDFSTTTENKTLKKEQTDYNSINSSHNSNNNKNINNSNNNTNINTYSNKKNNINNMSISIIENEESIKYNQENSYSLIELKDKVVKNYCFYKKLYAYHIKKPQIKLYYIDKCKIPKKINKNENIKGMNNNSINISNISENKNNEYNSFSISFNNNKNKKSKELIEDMALNLKNLDSDSKNNSEENLFQSSNDKNKIPVIKKNEPEFINNECLNCLNFDLSDEKEDKINLSKNEDELLKKEINNDIKKFDEQKNRHKRSLQINLDNNYIGNNLYSNYISNSTSKKGNSLCKRENINKTNDINEKVSLLTKKLANIFNKKKSNSVNIDNNIDNNNKNDIKKNWMNNSIHNYNDKKKKKIRKSLTEKEFVLGYSKLDNIFSKKNSSSNINSTYSLKERNSNIINNKMANLLNNRIEEEINDSELNDNIKLKQKANTHKMKQKNNLLEDEDENIDKKEENISKNNLESILSYNNNLSLNDNLLTEKVKSNTYNLRNQYTRTCKVNSNTIKYTEKNENKKKMKINRYLNLLKDNNICYISEQLINVLLLNDKKKIIDEYIVNINLFVNIIFDRLINEKNKIDLYAQIINKLNVLLSEYDSSCIKEEINLGNIIKNEFLKRINDKEYFNYIYIKDFDYVKSKLLLLIYFIFKIISFNLINIEEGFNIIYQLFNNYENIKDKDKKKYIYLEGGVYLFELLNTLIQKFSKKDDNTNNVANNIEDNFRKSLEDKDMPQNIKEKVMMILEKKSKKEKEKISINKNESFEKILYSPLKINSLNEKEENYINNDEIYLINILNDEKKEENEINYNLNNIFQKIENKIDNEEKDIKFNNKDNNTYDDIEEKINEKKNNENNENIHKNESINRLRKHYKVNPILEEQNEINNKNKKYRNTNCNFYNEYNKLMSKRQNTIQNNELLTENNIADNKNDDSDNNTKNIHNVTHKRKGKSKKKSKSTEKRNFLKSKDELYKKIETEEEKINKEEIRKDFENYLQFLEKEGIKKKEDIYDELSDSYNWKTIDNLIMGKNLKLEEIIKIYIDICKNKKDFDNNDLFKANEYIKTIIEYYTSNLSKNQTEILHLNMIEIYMAIDNIVDNNDSLYMHEIMGNLLFVLIKNKLYYMKDLNNFIEKSHETQINIAKVVKYTIIASGNSSKQYHNDFKFTKLFNNNDIFTLYVTNELYDNKNK